MASWQLVALSFKYELPVLGCLSQASSTSESSGGTISTDRITSLVIFGLGETYQNNSQNDLWLVNMLLVILARSYTAEPLDVRNRLKQLEGGSMHYSDSLPD